MIPVRAAVLAGALVAWGAGPLPAQVAETEQEAAGAPALEAGLTAGAIRVDPALAPGAEAKWAPAMGARVAWRSGLLAAIGIEAWRAELTREGGRSTVWAGGAALRVTPWAGRGWPLDPALHFGVEKVFVDDDEDRGLAFVAGVGVARIAPHWSLGLAIRTHHLRIEGEPVTPEEGDPVATAHDADLWEVRAEIAVALGGGGG